MALLADLFGLQTDQPLPPTIGDDEMRRAISERVRQAMGPITTGPLPVQAQDLPAAEPVRDYANTAAQAPYTPSFGSMSVRQPAPAPMSAEPLRDFNAVVSPAPRAPSMGSMSARPQPVVAPAPQPVAVASAQPRQATLSDRLGGFAEGFRSGGLLGAIAHSGEGVDRKIATENLTIKTLMSKGGLSRDEATAISRNPAMFQAALPAMFGPKTAVHNNRLVNMQTGAVIADYSDSSRQGPEIKKVIDANGDEISVVWDPTQKLHVPVGGAAGGIAPAPTMQGGAPSPIAIPPPPPGVNKKDYREAASKETVKQVTEIREKGLGAIDFLKRSDRAKVQIREAGDSLFGPIQGTDTWNTVVRTPFAAIPFDPTGANRNAQKFTEISALYKDLSSSFLKARFGSANLSDGDRKAAEDMVGGMRSADAKSAEQVLNNLERESFDTLQKALQARTIDLASVPPDIIKRGLAAKVLDPALVAVRVNSIEEALKLEKGTPFIPPDGSGRVKVR